MVDEDSVTGLTSNPSIFQKAIAQRRRLRRRRSRRCLQETDDPREIFFDLAIDDVQDACDVLRPVWDASGGADGFVSLEVDPGLAYDTQGTFDQALDLHGRVDRPNLYVKIPATKEGLPAIEDSIARGIPINVTLIFSLERYAEVVDAYKRGIARLHADGGDLEAVSSVASFFVCRLDTEADARLDAVGNTALAGEARDREREARLQALPGGVRRRGVGEPRRGRRVGAAPALGLDLDQEPGLPRRHVRRGADRPAHREHDAARDARSLPRPRRGARRHRRARTSPKPISCSPAWRRRESTTTTSSPSSRPKA